MRASRPAVTKVAIEAVSNDDDDDDDDDDDKATLPKNRRSKPPEEGKYWMLMYTQINRFS
jgi:hypothetical protein